MQVISGKIEKAKKCCIYGPEGVGKSSFAAQFPNPIFIDTEGSTTELDVERLAKPSSWEMLRQQVVWVKQQGPSRFGSLVIDTIDWAEMLCIESVCAQNGKKGIESFGWGEGYTYTMEEFGRLLNQLSDVIDAGINVVLTAHAQIKKFDQPDEMGAYDRYQLKLGKKTSSQTSPLVKEWADMVLFLNYKTFSVAADKEGKKHKAQGGIRTIYATHHPAWDAKNRHGLPDEFPMDYAHIAHLFKLNKSPQKIENQIFEKNSYYFHPESDSYVEFKKGGPIPSGSDFAHCNEISKEEYEKGKSTTQRTAEDMTHDLVTGLRNVGLEEQKHGLSEQEVMGEGINPNIPQSLRDLMTQHNVTEQEIQIVVSQKGYYTMDTPITNYDPTFINGVLVGAWQQVYGMVTDFRKTLPF